MSKKGKPLYVEYVVSNDPIFGTQVVRHYFHEIP